jgi:hypothetical protein
MIVFRDEQGNALLSMCDFKITLYIGGANSQFSSMIRFSNPNFQAFKDVTLYTDEFDRLIKQMSLMKENLVDCVDYTNLDGDFTLKIKSNHTDKLCVTSELSYLNRDLARSVVTLQFSMPMYCIDDIISSYATEMSLLKGK